jgi:hypothetical protein
MFNEIGVLLGYLHRDLMKAGILALRGQSLGATLRPRASFKLQAGNSRSSLSEHKLKGSIFLEIDSQPYYSFKGFSSRRASRVTLTSKQDLVQMRHRNDGKGLLQCPLLTNLRLGGPKRGWLRQTFGGRL